MINTRELGFARIAAAVPRTRVADVSANAAEITGLCAEAARRGCAAAVFPELCLTACTCGDLFGTSTLQRGALEGLEAVLEQTGELGTVGVIGLPLVREGRLYDCAAVVQRGRVLGVVPRRRVSGGGLRCFSSGSGTSGSIRLFGRDVPFGTDIIFECADMEPLSLGVEIGDDLWAPEPLSAAMALGAATLIASPSAGGELMGGRECRRQLVSSQSARFLCACVRAGAGSGESTAEQVFAGHCLIGENGSMLAESRPFCEGLMYADADFDMLMSLRSLSGCFRRESAVRRIPFALGALDPPLERAIRKYPFLPSGAGEGYGGAEGILDVQAHGLAGRVAHVRAKTLVIGVSGGLDSCLALLAAARAMDILGRDRGGIIAVTMPCFGTTARTRGNAEVLCRELGVSFREVDVSESVRLHFRDIGQDFGKRDSAFENGQARERTQVLMDIANMTGGLVVGTGDMSELALGWATYNGDHMSMYGVNVGIPKTLVRYVVSRCAETAPAAGLRDVLMDILATPVSPELLPAGQGGGTAQVTEDLVGPYALHDFFLFNMIGRGFGPAKLFALARYAFGEEYSGETVLKWLRVFCRRFFAQQFKRSCLPDGPRISAVSLSPRSGWLMPSDASAALWMKELDGIKPQ